MITCDFRTKHHAANFIAMRDATTVTPPIMIIFSSMSQVRRWLHDDAEFGAVTGCSVYNKAGDVVAYVENGKVVFV